MKSITRLWLNTGHIVLFFQEHYIDVLYCCLFPVLSIVCLFSRFSSILVPARRFSCVILRNENKEFVTSSLWILCGSSWKKSAYFYCFVSKKVSRPLLEDIFLLVFFLLWDPLSYSFSIKILTYTHLAIIWVLPLFNSSHSRAVSISDVSSGTIHKPLASGGLCFEDEEQELCRSVSLEAEWC